MKLSECKIGDLISIYAEAFKKDIECTVIGMSSGECFVTCSNGQQGRTKDLNREVTLLRRPAQRKGETKEISMKNTKDVKIVDYKVYNNKVVVVWFDDGTNEKATCFESDEFDLERGVEVCCLKHMYGTSNYKSMLKGFMKQVKAVDKAKEDKKQQEELIANKRAKNARRKAKTRAKRRAERVAEMKEAYLAAMNEYNTHGVQLEELYDDFK